MPSQPPAPVPLPEAPVSITLKATLHGHEVLVTLRGVDFASVKAQVEDASAWLQAQAPVPVPWDPKGPQASPPPASEEQRWCPKHGDKLTLNHKEGRSWWSHRLAEGGFCKGK